jgi:hypothetical protein
MALKPSGCEPNRCFAYAGPPSDPSGPSGPSGRDTQQADYLQGFAVLSCVPLIWGTSAIPSLDNGA